MVDDALEPFHVPSERDEVAGVLLDGGLDAVVGGDALQPLHLLQEVPLRPVESVSQWDAAMLGPGAILALPVGDGAASSGAVACIGAGLELCTATVTGQCHVTIVQQLSQRTRL